MVTKLNKSFGLAFKIRNEVVYGTCARGMKFMGGLFPAVWVWVLPARVLGAPQLLLQNPNQAGSHHLGSAQLLPGILQ